MDEEIAVLRTLIRERAATGDLDAARRGIEALSRVLRAQKSQGEAADRLARWIEETLDDFESQDSEIVGAPPAH